MPQKKREGRHIHFIHPSGAVKAALLQRALLWPAEAVGRPLRRGPKPLPQAAHLPAPGRQLDAGVADGVAADQQLRGGAPAREPRVARDAARQQPPERSGAAVATGRRDALTTECSGKEEGGEGDFHSVGAPISS